MALSPPMVVRRHAPIRLSAFFSVVAHTLILLVPLAIPVALEEKDTPQLEITLVQARSDKKPRHPDALAQAHLDGGGESEGRARARSPFPVREIGRPSLPTTTIQARPGDPGSASEERLHILQAHSDLKAPDTQAAARKAAQQPPQPLAFLSLDRLRTERAHLAAELDTEYSEYQKRPRKKFISARTQEYRYAAYLKEWEAKVERIGNLNYPDEAKRREIQGTLRLDVALNPDGSIHSVEVLRPSPHAVLNEAARRIVELSAPFPAFPPDIRAETDILHITRTWLFNDRLISTNP